jgi:pilus assembly protein CpaF
MISIVISEKGGTERRERFDKPEITIGRVKGNDVLLSKGNVSKRHARLLERDGRFIVTDLKSTNGTYVNHRRITHAVIREGDRIYIGDFVLWVVADDSGGVGAVTDAPNNDRAASGNGGASDSDPEPESIPDIPFGSPALEPARAGDAERIVNHFPIEHDPDDSGPPANGAAAHPAGSKGPATPAPAATEAPSTAESTGSMPASATGQHALPIPEAEPTIARFSLPGDVAADLKERRALHQKWLDALVERVERGMAADLPKLEGTAAPDTVLAERVRAEVGRQLVELQRTAGWPADLEAEVVRRAALAELLELGPLEGALADEATTQLRIMLGHTEVTRRGRKQPIAGLDFTSEHAIGRALGAAGGGG